MRMPMASLMVWRVAMACSIWVWVWVWVWVRAPEKATAAWEASSQPATRCAA